MKNLIPVLLSIVLLSGQAYSQKYFTGLKFDNARYAKVLMKAPLTRAMYGNSLPSSASVKKFSPVPLSQGNYGTCVGWSSTYAALSIVQAMQNNWTDKETISSNAFSPTFTYSLSKFQEDYNCSLGTYIDEALNVLKTQGAVKFSDFKIDCPDNIPNDLIQRASQYRIGDFAKVFDLYDQPSFKIEATKKSLAEHKPVVICIKCAESFFTASGCWAPTEDPAGDYGGHAICVVGYDDNMYGGAFEIQNSWGEEWGNGGYMWIKYSDFTGFTQYAFEIIEGFKARPDKKYQLSGNLRFVMNNGTTMEASLSGSIYKMNEAYHSGNKFRLYISNNEPAFVYAFGHDNTNKTFQIFPYAPNISAALTYKQNDVAIPDEEHYIQMDNTTGKDYLCVLYSLNPLDVDDIRDKVEKGYGSFQDKVQSALAKELISFSEVTYSSRGIGFRASSSTKSVVALIVETVHLP
jgi:C1A family cysteine protease